MTLHNYSDFSYALLEHDGFNIKPHGPTRTRAVINLEVVSHQNLLEMGRKAHASFLALSPLLPPSLVCELLCQHNIFQT